MTRPSDHKYFSVVVLILCLSIGYSEEREVNVDQQMTGVFQIVELDHEQNEKFPLLGFESVMDVVVLPSVTTKCEDGYAFAPKMERLMGNTLDILSENETVLHMKMRVGEARFFYPKCRIYSSSNIFPQFFMPLDGTLLSSDYEISLALNYLPTCNYTLAEVRMVEMSTMSLKFLEAKIPKFIADSVSSFLAKYNKELMDKSVVKAVEERIRRLSEKIDLCVIFHPNLRANDEL